MKLSSKTTYGLRFLIHLAASNQTDFLQLHDIATKENISLKYLESIVSALKSTGIIDVKRGAKGGYKLAKPAEAIPLFQIVSALETDARFEDNLTKQQQKTEAEIVVDNQIKKYNDHLISYLSQTLLSDLVTDYNKQTENQMFYI